MCGERLMPDDDGHVHARPSLLLRMVVMTVMRVMAERFLQLLMLAAYRDAVDVNRYRHDNTRRFPAVAGRRRPAAAAAGVVAGSPADAARQQRAGTGALHDAGLDSLPLGAPVLEPDLHLDLAEAQLARDHRALGQRQVLLAVELLLELEQLVARERRPPSPVPAAPRTRGSGRRDGRRRLRGPVVRRATRRRRRRTVHVDDAAVGRGPTLDVRLVVGLVQRVAARAPAVVRRVAVDVAAAVAVDDRRRALSF